MNGRHGTGGHQGTFEDKHSLQMRLFEGDPPDPA